MLTVEEFYRDKKWIKQLEVLKSERTTKGGVLFCEHCGKPIIKKYDCIGHHVIELTEDNVNDYDISLNPENIKLIHHKCHNEIHNRFGYDRIKRIYLVYGSPCAGKRQYINDVAGHDDIILDIDSIYECISINKRYEHSKRLSRNVFVIRDCILDMIKTRNGKWINAYILGGYPLASERERIISTMNAIPIFIDTDKDECLLNAELNGRLKDKKFIDDWFENYIES